MSLREKYDALITRLHLSENWEKYNAANIYRTEENGGLFLAKHLEEIRDAFFKLANENSACDPEQLKQTIRNRIDEANTYLDEHDWK